MIKIEINFVRSSCALFGVVVHRVFERDNRAIGVILRSAATAEDNDDNDYHDYDNDTATRSSS